MSTDSLQDVKSCKFWLAVFAEFLGTLLLVLVGCGSCADFSKAAVPQRPADYVQIALAFGLSVASIVWMIAHVSGGHINPAVTIGFFVTRKISFLRTLLYIVLQSAGALCGAGILYLLSPSGANDMLGNTQPGDGVSNAQACVTEALITFVLVLVVFAVCDSRRPALAGVAPLAIGLAVAMCHLWAIPYTGSAMNPARALGSAVVSGYIGTHVLTHAMYWWGPLLGGILGALLYDLVFAVNASVDKAKAFCFRRDYDDSQFEGAGTGAEDQPLQPAQQPKYSRLE